MTTTRNGVDDDAYAREDDIADTAPDPAGDYHALQAAIDRQVQQYADPNTPAPAIVLETDSGDGARPFDALLTQAVGAPTRLSDVVTAATNAAPGPNGSDGRSGPAVGQYQLMPGTAKEMAKRAGIPWDEKKFRDPGPGGAQYSQDLALPYVEKLLERYGGENYLAAAAYNSGPGNVDEWLMQNGDPRTGAITEWEFANRIPFQETRKYAVDTQFK